MALKRIKKVNPAAVFHGAVENLAAAVDGFERARSGFLDEQCLYQANADLYLKRAALAGEQAQDANKFLVALRDASA